MQRIPLPYRATRRFTPLVCDLLDDAPALREHQAYRPTLAGLRAAAEARRFDPAARATLVDALRRQYAGHAPHAAVQDNIAALGRPDALTVTTGHQLCLFTGPLYVPFKLLNAVRLARTLANELKRPVVPVFWMATEDHDRAEIDHAWLNGHRVHWPGEAAGPVGGLTLDGIDAVLKEVELHLGPGAYSAALMQLLRESHRPGRTLAEATRHLVDALFGRFGLVVLDGDDPALKQLFVPVMREELLNQVAARAVRYANDRLEAAYGVQAHARDINLFHLRPGHRARILEEDGRFRALEGGPGWTADELLAEVERAPERFSPNVLLRPVYQELVLPNIAYIGGGGELAYWMQLRWLFQAVQVPMPAVVLRTSAAFLRAKDLDRWAKCGLAVEELFAPIAEVRNKAALAASGIQTDTAAERERLTALYDALSTRAFQADPTLKGAVEAERQRALHGLGRIEGKLLRAARRREATTLDRIGQVHEALFPGGGLQERRDNILPMLAAQGTGLLDTLLEALEPLDPHFSLLVE